MLAQVPTTPIIFGEKSSTDLLIIDFQIPEGVKGCNDGTWAGVNN